jgi:hypothetical protein
MDEEEAIRFSPYGIEASKVSGDNRRLSPFGELDALWAGGSTRPLCFRSTISEGKVESDKSGPKSE